MTATSNRYQASIEADPDLPIIHITRDFDATPAERSLALLRLASAIESRAGEIVAAECRNT